jgi:hypothetical protein
MRKMTRVNQLYCIPERKGKDGKIKPARQGILPFGKSYVYENILHRSDDNPYVPGTRVRRLKLLDLSPTAKAVFNDEIEALVEGLRQHRDAATASDPTA